MIEKNKHNMHAGEQSGEKIIGRNYFERVAGSDQFRVPYFGDILDPYNDDAKAGEKEGLLDVMRDQSGAPISAKLTEKFYKQKKEEEARGRDLIKQFHQRITDRYDDF